MKSIIKQVNDHGLVYECLAFICPGCAFIHGTGLLMLPVNTNVKTPRWSWNGNLEAPSLSPSILTFNDEPVWRCHSFLSNGVFEFLEDCAHVFAGQSVPMPDLPDWFVKETGDSNE